MLSFELRGVEFCSVRGWWPRWSCAEQEVLGAASSIATGPQRSLQFMLVAVDLKIRQTVQKATYTEPRYGINKAPYRTSHEQGTE